MNSILIVINTQQITMCMLLYPFGNISSVILV